uniref:Uncharacterized protein n=1 Tax=Lepeophtheirus salmonis TaxID=72036 RepID=A0A0K2TY15_LEPSM
MILPRLTEIQSYTIALFQLMFDFHRAF